MSVRSAWKVFFFFQISKIWDVGCAWSGQGWPPSSLGWGICSCLCCLWPWPVQQSLSHQWGWRPPVLIARRWEIRAPLLLTAHLDALIWSVWKGAKCTCRYYMRQALIPLNWAPAPTSLPGVPSQSPCCCQLPNRAFFLALSSWSLAPSAIIPFAPKVHTHSGLTTPLAPVSFPPSLNTPPKSRSPTTLQLGTTYSNFCPWLSFVIYLQKLQV